MSKQLFTIERLLGLPNKRDVVDLTKDHSKKSMIEMSRHKRRYESFSGDSAAESDKESVTSDGELGCACFKISCHYCHDQIVYYYFSCYPFRLPIIT